MEKYNFETRELVPYREDWNRGGNVKMCGALWYIKEKDGLYLKINEDKIVGNARLMHDYCVAKGLPAAMLAQGALLFSSDFNANDCYQAYFKETQSLFPNRQAYAVLPILEDWEFALSALLPFTNNKSGYLNRYEQMKVGIIIRDLFNPFRTGSLPEAMQKPGYFACRLNGLDDSQIIHTRMPNLSEKLPAPVVVSRAISRPSDYPKIQVEGFVASVINVAMVLHRAKEWRLQNFTDVAIIRRIIKNYKRSERLFKIEKFSELSFAIPTTVEKLCAAYMETFEPIMRRVWKYKPDVQLACLEEENIHTYIYACECSETERLLSSELYNSLSYEQKRILVSYGRRFIEWLPKHYPITTLSQKRVMDAIGRDLSPMEITIRNNIKVTHTDEQEENPKKKQTNTKAKTKTTKVPKATKEIECPYINADVLAEKGTYTVEHFQRMLRQACEQEAKVLVDFLIKQEKYGNLDFHGANMKAIYTNLRSKCFPTMRDYSYQNFAGAWKEALKNPT